MKTTTAFRRLCLFLAMFHFGMSIGFAWQGHVWQTVLNILASVIWFADYVMSHGETE